MRRALYFAALLTGSVLLIACGQKGPLFIPGDDQPSQYQNETPPQPAPR